MEDDGVVSSCCMDDPDAAEHDPESFDCETCEVRKLRSNLGPDDTQAMEVYGTLTSPVIKDLGLYPLAWAALGLRLTRDQARGMLERMDRLHQHSKVMAERERNTGGGGGEDGSPGIPRTAISDGDE